MNKCRVAGVHALAALAAFAIASLATWTVAAEQSEDVVDCEVAATRFEIVLCSNRGAFDLINWMHQRLFFAPDVSDTPMVSQSFARWLEAVEERCMSEKDVGSASQCLYDEASGQEALELAERMNNLHEGGEDMDYEECDSCSESEQPASSKGEADASVGPGAPTNPKLQINKGPLIGEIIDADKLGRVFFDADGQRRYEWFRGNIVEYLDGKNLSVDIASGRIYLYLIKGQPALWIGVNFVVGGHRVVASGSWYQANSEDDSPFLCVEWGNDAYCSKLLLSKSTQDGGHHGLLLRAHGNLYDYWSVNVSELLTPQVALAMSAEPQRQALRDIGVDPDSYEELVNLYKGYLAAEICEQKGVYFDRQELEALQAAAKSLEQKLGHLSSVDAAWELAVEQPPDTRMWFDNGYSNGVEGCRRTKGLLDEYIFAHTPAPRKPF